MNVVERSHGTGKVIAKHAELCPKYAQQGNWLTPFKDKLYGDVNSLKLICFFVCVQVEV